MEAARPIHWLAPALRDFLATFTPEGRREALRALTIAAEGGKADLAKPMHGMGSGVFGIALRSRSDAFRVVYAVQLSDAVWVVHAFQKKATHGIGTPKREIDLIRSRPRTLKEALR